MSYWSKFVFHAFFTQISHAKSCIFLSLLFSLQSLSKKIVSYWSKFVFHAFFTQISHAKSCIFLSLLFSLQSLSLKKLCPIGHNFLFSNFHSNFLYFDFNTCSNKSTIFINYPKLFFQYKVNYCKYLGNCILLKY